MLFFSGKMQEKPLRDAVISGFLVKDCCDNETTQVLDSSIAAFAPKCEIPRGAPASRAQQSTAGDLCILGLWMARHTSGWIKLHRKILANRTFDDPLTFALFCRLLLMATRKPSGWVTNGHFEKLRAGQVLCSTIELAQTLGAPRMNIQRRLERLESEHVIVQQTGNKGRIVTICKWREYQTSDEESGQHIEQQDVQQTGNKRAAKWALMEKGEEEKKRSNTPFSPPDGGESQKVNRRRLNEQADELAEQTLGAIYNGFDLERAEAELPISAHSVIKARYKSYENLHRAWSIARSDGQLTPFEHGVRKSFRAALPRIVEQLKTGNH